MIVDALVSDKRLLCRLADFTKLFFNVQPAAKSDFYIGESKLSFSAIPSFFDDTLCANR